MKKSKQQVSVILNADVDGVGFSGEHVIVRPGFARNFLLVGNRADLATPERIKQRQAEITKAETRRTAELDQRRDLAEQITAEPLTAKLKVGSNKQVFGSLTAAEVAKRLKADRKIEITASQLSGLPLKSLGSHSVSVKLGLGVTAALPITITGEAQKSEADSKEVAATK